METTESNIRISVRVTAPRRSTRAIPSAREAQTATDFSAIVRVGPLARDPDREVEHLGEVTLCRISEVDGWGPCRSMSQLGLPRYLAPTGTSPGPIAVEHGWMSDSLRQLVRSIRSASPLGIDVSRRLVEALAGVGADLGAGSDGVPEILVDRTLVLGLDALIPGDVVEHTNSRRVGAIEIGRIHRDGTSECRMRLAAPLDDDPNGTIYWNSARVRRIRRRAPGEAAGAPSSLRWRDPYRRYLAMAHAEDDLARQARRAGHRKSRCGACLPREAWEKLYWRLSNLRRHGLDGRLAYYPLGRDAWEQAAMDCLDRRDRAESARWAESDRRISGMSREGAIDSARQNANDEVESLTRNERAMIKVDPRLYGDE